MQVSAYLSDSEKKVIRSNAQTNAASGMMLPSIPIQKRARSIENNRNLPDVAPLQEKHLPHEAWHVVQQKQGRVQPMLQMKTIAEGTVQRILRAEPTSDAKDIFLTLVNKILKGYARLNPGADHNFALQYIDTNKKIPVEAMKLCAVLHKIISAGNETVIRFAVSDLDVFIGGFDQESIDLTDVRAFGVNPGKQMGPTAASMLVHELEEQFRKQVHGDEIDEAHGDYAIPAEEEAVGGYREGQGPKE